MDIECTECGHIYDADYDYDWTFCPKCGTQNPHPEAE